MTYVIYQSGAAHRATPRLAALATKVVFTTEPGGAVNGVAFTGQPVVQLQDAFNQPIALAGVSITLTRSSGSATLSGAVTLATDATGKATFAGLTLTGASGNHSLTASSSGLTSAVSASFALAVGAASKLVISNQPSGAVAGVALTGQPVVRLTDQSSNVVAQAGVAIIAAAHSGVAGTLSGATSVNTDSSGISTFTNLAMSAAESGVSLDFSASGLTGVTSATFTVDSTVSSGSYTTSFPATQDPIVEDGGWINGAAVGLDWSNVQVASAGLACGTQTGAVGFNDSIAVRSGAWANDQQALATLNMTGGGVGQLEVELLLRFAISAHSATGYEITFQVGGVQAINIVRWNGALGSFTVLAGPFSFTPTNGDQLWAKIVGTVITVYQNGVQRATYDTASDGTKYASGAPGLGFFRQGGPPPSNTSAGFSAFSASPAASGVLTNDSAFIITHEFVDANTLLAFDFASPHNYYFKDTNNPPGALNHGWLATPFGGPDPLGTDFGRATQGLNGGPCVTNGGHSGAIGQALAMAQHRFKSAVSEFWARYCLYVVPGYSYGQEKAFTINGLTDDSGIRFGTVFYSSPQFHFYPINQGVNLTQNQGTPYSLVSGHWNGIILHLKLNGTGGTDLVEMYADDGGVTGISWPASPTLRMRYTNASLRAGGDSSLFGSMWWENWANPPATGEMRYDQLYVSKAAVGWPTIFT